MLERLLVISLVLLPAVADEGEPDGLLWRGLELSREASDASQRGRTAVAAEGWRAARGLFDAGLAVFEGGSPALPWDPADSPGPQLLLEAARALYYQGQPQQALARLARLEEVLPPGKGGNDSQLHGGVVQQWAFRCHAAASDYEGASERLLQRLLPAGTDDCDGAALPLTMAAWRQLSLPMDTQLQAAEALSRDTARHPRLA
jgi:hypothetical protein